MIIDVWSDVVCPWCFIGRRRLQKALAEFPHAKDVTVRHRAFQLQPEITETVATSELLAHKYHVAPAQVKEMQANVCVIADGEGLCYDLDSTLSGNTLDAHRLLLWAEGIGKQEELLEAMYSSYFEKSLPLFSHEDLLRITDQVEIDHAAAKAILDSDEYRNSVLEDGELARKLGANGVPFFVIDMKFGISGAQPVEAFVQTLETAWKELA
jgi:predicted DsbA family dithiol-disulfide isomerase